MSPSICWATTATDELAKALTPCTDQSPVILVVHSKDRSGFFANLIGNCLNRFLGGADGVLGTTASDLSRARVIRGLVQVDLSAGFILDFIDRSASLAQDARNSTRRNTEFNDVVGLLFKLGRLSPAKSDNSTSD